MTAATTIDATKALQDLVDGVDRFIAHLKDTDRLRRCYTLPAVETARAIAAQLQAHAGSGDDLDVSQQRLELYRTRGMRPDVLTPSGQYFDFLNPETNVYSVEDVAHNLAHLCRFTGSTKRHYSVAQHAVIVSHLVPPHLAWEGLHHDDAEFMLGDVSGPLKALLPGYKVIEKRVEAVMFARLGIHYMPPEVKYADRVALATEKRDLVAKVHPDAWAWLIDDDTGEPYMHNIGSTRDVWALTEGIEPMAQTIVPLGAEDAKALYLARHYELQALRGGLA